MLKQNLSHNQTPLKPRISLPIFNSWLRLQTSKLRKEMFIKAFSKQSGIYVITGPAGAGKSQMSLAICDFYNLSAAYPSKQEYNEVIEDFDCLIIDPVSCYETEELKELLNDYQHKIIILIDRTLDDFNDLFGDVKNLALNGKLTLVNLKLPNKQIIEDYIKKLLTNRNNNLTDDDYSLLAENMVSLNMSLEEINQVSVDAALDKLKIEETIDLEAFFIAIQRFQLLQEFSNENLDNI